MSDARQLSMGQEALWLLQRKQADMVAYNVPVALRIHTPLDLATLGVAVHCTADRHDLVRSRFPMVDEAPRRVVTDASAVTLNVRDAAGATDQSLREMVNEETAVPFRLDQDPVFRFVLFRRAPDDAVLLVLAHHIATDLSSHLLVLRDLLEAYEALLSGGEPSWLPLEARYDAHVFSEQRFLASSARQRAEDYWRATCAATPSHLNLPYDRKPHGNPNGPAAHYRATFPTGVAKRVRPAARAAGVTPFALLFGVFQATLHRACAQGDFVVGYTSTTRLGRQLRDVVGYFANTLPCPVHIHPRATFREVVAAAASRVRESSGYQSYPFALMPPLLSLSSEHNGSRSVQVLFTLRSADHLGPLMRAAVDGEAHLVRINGLLVSIYEVNEPGSQFDLSVNVAESGSSVGASFTYPTDLFDERTVVTIAGMYGRMLSAAVTDMAARLETVAVLTNREREAQLAMAAGLRRHGLRLTPTT